MTQMAHLPVLPAQGRVPSVSKNGSNHLLKSIKVYLRVATLVFPLILTYWGCASCSDNPVLEDDTPTVEDIYTSQQNERLGRGVNLGNALEAPAESEWGVTLKEEYSRLIKEAGFDAVRAAHHPGNESRSYGGRRHRRMGRRPVAG